jgi:hypothetical protein
VKIRGVRVEIEEVERVLSKAIEVECNRNKIVRKAGCIKGDEGYNLEINSEKILESIAVITIEDKNNQGFHLVLFIQKNILDLLDIDTGVDLKKLLSSKIGAIYLPLFIILIDGIPYTITGKLDRQKLNIMKESYLNLNYIHEESIDDKNYDDINNDNENIESKYNTNDYHKNDKNDKIKKMKNIVLTIMNIFKFIIPSMSLILQQNQQKTTSTDINQLNSTIHDAYIDYNFYTLGGDSMTAVEAIWKLNNSLNSTMGISNTLFAGFDASNTSTNINTNTYTSTNINTNTNTNTSTNTNTNTASPTENDKLNLDIKDDKDKRIKINLNVLNLKNSIRLLAEIIYDQLYDSCNDNDGSIGGIYSGGSMAIKREVGSRKRKLEEKNEGNLKINQDNSNLNYDNFNNKIGKKNKDENLKNWEETNRREIKHCKEATPKGYLLKVSVFSKSDNWDFFPRDPDLVPGPIGLRNSNGPRDSGPVPGPAGRRDSDLVSGPASRRDSIGIFIDV